MALQSVGSQSLIKGRQPKTECGIGQVSAGPLSVVQYLSVVLVPFKLLELAEWLIQWTVDSSFLRQQVVMEERMKASGEN